MATKDPAPEVRRLEHLVDAVLSGSIVLPKFQRPFVWGRKAMLDLWDSIYKGYPIGSLLIWESSEQMKSERSVFGFNLETTTYNRYPIDYILDGQQRLTTICGALYWNGTETNSRWRIYFDLITESFVHLKGVPQITHFPLNKLIKTSDFLKQCKLLEQLDDADNLISIAERLLKSVKDYKVAVVKIGDMSIDEVVPIFERINSKGRKLTVVDLMRVVTWKQKFDLATEIQTISKEILNLGYGEIKESDIIRSIAAAANLGVNKNDINKLRELKIEDLKSAVASAYDGFSQALTFLDRIANLGDSSWLPYSMQLTHLAEFFRVNKSRKDVDLKVLERWFWRTSFTRQFAGASTGQNARDLEQMRTFAKGKGELQSTEDPIDITHLLFDVFNLGHASSIAFILLLKAQRPKEDIYCNQINDRLLHIKSRTFCQNIIASNFPFSDCNLNKMISLNSVNGIIDFSALNPANLSAHLLDGIESVSDLGQDVESLIRKRADRIRVEVENRTGLPAIYSIPEHLDDEAYHDQFIEDEYSDEDER